MNFGTDVGVGFDTHESYLEVSAGPNGSAKVSIFKSKVFDIENMWGGTVILKVHKIS